MAGGLIVLLALILLCVSAVVLGVIQLSKRLHDLDLPGWLSLFAFSPLLWLWFKTALVRYGLIGETVYSIYYIQKIGAFMSVAFACYLTFAKGSDGENQYGEDPLPSLDK